MVLEHFNAACFPCAFGQHRFHFAACMVGVMDNPRP
jgi:hypothetical protein